MAPVRARGTVYLVGAGPGDPDLISVRGNALLQRAGLVIADALAPIELVERLPPEVEVIRFGRLEGRGRDHQSAINRLMIARARRGTMVVRLKGGDPFIFGRGGEELAYLRARGVEVDIVPGITAAAGCAAYAGIPLTHRDLSQSVAFVTAHGKNSIDNLDWVSLARDKQTLAFYMAVRRFTDLMNNLIGNGRSPATPVAIIEKGTTPQQRVIRGTLGQLALLAEAHHIEAPAMLIVGEVAALGREQTVARPQTAEKYAKPDYKIAQKG